MKKFVLVFLCALSASRLPAQQPAGAFAISGAAAPSANTLAKTANTGYELDDDEDDWRGKFLYLGLSLLWIPRIYSDISYNNMASVGVEFTADIRPLDFLSVRVGVELSQDLLIIDSSDIVTDMILDFPVAVAYVSKPIPNIMLEPYLGGSLNLSLQGITNPYFFSWHAGVELSLKLGFGILTIEPRFSQDLGNSSITTFKGDVLEYQRSTIHIGVGYKVGIIKRFF